MFFYVYAFVYFMYHFKNVTIFLNLQAQEAELIFVKSFRPTLKISIGSGYIVLSCVWGLFLKS